MGNNRVMTLKYKDFKGKNGLSFRVLKSSLLACVFCAALPFGAQAQNLGAKQPTPAAPVEEIPSAQLPADYADEQVPQSFGNTDDVEDFSATAVTEPKKTENTAADASNVVADQPASVPAAENVPPQPADRGLVPATAMGAAAQNAASGARVSNPAPPSPVSVEEEANIEPPVTDILEKYTAKTGSAGADVSADTGFDEDLPTVNNDSMIKLRDAGLEGDATTSPQVVDGGVVQGQPAKSSEQLQEEIRSEAYDAAITGMFPLSPNQIRSLVKRYDQTQEATKAKPYEPPRPEISVINISLDPGVTPASIKTATGNVTTINILDATGAPWPVQDVTWAGDYEVVEPEEGGHIIRITPMSEFARGNIVIRMLTLKTPLTLSLETGRDIVQYRVDARIPEYGPFAAAPLMQGAKSTMVAGSPTLTSLLDGVMPGGMMKLNVAGVDGRTTAFSMNGTTYVRTPLTLLSPAWQSSVSSADGMNVYSLSSAPVLLLSDGGEFVRATISEKEDLLDE